MEFLQTTYDAAADLGRWDRGALECPLGETRTTPVDTVGQRSWASDRSHRRPTTFRGSLRWEDGGSKSSTVGERSEEPGRDELFTRVGGADDECVIPTVPLTKAGRATCRQLVDHEAIKVSMLRSILQ